VNAARNGHYDGTRVIELRRTDNKIMLITLDRPFTIERNFFESTTLIETLTTSGVRRMLIDGNSFWQQTGRGKPSE